MADFKKKIMDVLFEQEDDEVLEEKASVESNDKKENIEDNNIKSKPDTTITLTAKDLLYDHQDSESGVSDFLSNNTVSDEDTDKGVKKKQKKVLSRMAYSPQGQISPIFGLIGQEEKKKKTVSIKDIKKATSIKEEEGYTSVILSPIYGCDLDKANDAKESLEPYEGYLENKREELHQEVLDELMNSNESYVSSDEDTKEAVRAAIEESVYELGNTQQTFINNQNNRINSKPLDLNQEKTKEDEFFGSVVNKYNSDADNNNNGPVENGDFIDAYNEVDFSNDYDYLDNDDYSENDYTNNEYSNNNDFVENNINNNTFQQDNLQQDDLKQDDINSGIQEIDFTNDLIDTISNLNVESNQNKYDNLDDFVESNIKEQNYENSQNSYNNGVEEEISNQSEVELNDNNNENYVFQNNEFSEEQIDDSLNNEPQNINVEEENIVETSDFENNVEDTKTIEVHSNENFENEYVEPSADEDDEILTSQINSDFIKNAIENVNNSNTIYDTKQMNLFDYDDLNNSGNTSQDLFGSNKEEK